eukprot:TRINITY_DN1900_c0_g1_i1.p1 TRINITY_DN1900_c0_g1~~TRINITY_DN1900_c0_g1_i1.p1  ORF type:complete len:387 (-),score=40.37 TRINITY_DN1900_c0_g1_i1:136-1296(-)
MGFINTIISALHHRKHNTSKVRESSLPPCDLDCIFDNISQELILFIFSFLTHQDICSLARVSTGFLQIAYDRTLWKTFTVGTHMKRKSIKKTVNTMAASGRLNYVQRLSLRNKHINDETMEYILRCAPNLKDIRLYNVEVTEKATQSLVNHCPRLEIVHMHGGKATDKCLELLSKGFKNLRHIDLQQVENVTTRGLIHILARRNLSCMNFREMHGSELLALGPHCSNFVTMDLSYSHIQDHEFKQFLQYCQKLKNISLANCKTITDKTLEHLVEFLPNMSELNISNCPNLTNYGINLLLRRASNLVSLNLGHLSCVHPINVTRFTRAGYEYKTSNTKLQILDLSFTDVKDDDVITLTGHFDKLKKVSLRDCMDLKFLSPKVIEVIA